MEAAGNTGADLGQDAPTAEMPRLGEQSATPGPPPMAAAAPDPRADAFAERPQVFLGAAFAGGVVAAKLLKRLRR